MPFHPEYARLVLEENFEDARRLFLDPLLDIHAAHLVMLAETGIVPRADARALRRALANIDAGAVRAATFDAGCEDLFYFVERLIAGAAGANAAGHLHTARSRNDIDMTLYRMRLRDDLLALLDATLAVRRSLLEAADSHVDTIFPAHTHTQPAQPTTLGHYLLAVVEEVERHAVRLVAAFESTNRCPLGACAITGTGFPIDRGRTAALLGFAAPTGNTYGSIATVDYVLEGVAAAAVTLVGLGRFVQDMLLWCTREVGHVRLADGLVQSSSIMPQKRNPVALEHARALASKALAQAAAIPIVVHNTPFGDIVDTEDDLQPLLATMFRDAVRAVSLVAVAMDGAQFDVARMRARADEGFVTITELADTLAREHALPFQSAHAIAARLVEVAGAAGTAPTAEALACASRETIGREIRWSDSALASVLSPEHFVAVRRTPGGPAPEVVREAIARSRALFDVDLAALAARRGALDAADRARAAALAAL